MCLCVCNNFFFTDKMLDFSDNVSTRVFRLALTEYWMAFLNRLWQTIKPGATAHDFTSRKTSNYHLSYIEKVFSYFENGVDKRRLRGCLGYVRVQQLLTLYKLPSTELIGIYNTLLSTPQVVGLLPPQHLDAKRFEGFDTELLTIILKERSDRGDVWAQPFFKQGLSVEESNRIRCLFKYPPTELFLNRWRCSHAKVAGWLFLSSKHLSFCSETVNVNIPLLNVTTIEIVGFVTFFKDIRVEFNVAEASPKPSPPLPRSPSETPPSKPLQQQQQQQQRPLPSGTMSFKMPRVAKSRDDSDDNSDNDDDDGDDDGDGLGNASGGRGKKRHSSGKKSRSPTRVRSSSTSSGKKRGKGGNSNGSSNNSKSNSKSGSKRSSVNSASKKKKKDSSTYYKDDEDSNGYDVDDDNTNNFDSVDYKDDNVLGGEGEDAVASPAAAVVEKKVLSFGKFLCSMDDIVRLVVNEAKMIGNKSIKSSL